MSKCWTSSPRQGEGQSACRTGPSPSSKQLCPPRGFASPLRASPWGLRRLQGGWEQGGRAGGKLGSRASTKGRLLALLAQRPPRPDAGQLRAQGAPRPGGPSVGEGRGGQPRGGPWAGLARPRCPAPPGAREAAPAGPGRAGGGTAAGDAGRPRGYK